MFQKWLEMNAVKCFIQLPPNDSGFVPIFLSPLELVEFFLYSPEM